MLPSPKPPVKPACPSGRPSFITRWVWGGCGPSTWKDQRTIWLIFGGAALLLWLTGLDTTLARLVYHPEITQPAFHAATFLRHNGTFPGTALAVLALVAMLWPGLWRSRPLLYRTALVVAFTAVFGVGLINQSLAKKLADRPRPQESVLIETATYADTFRGNSMPSGHAAMGFLLAAPFFPLRRQRPKLAATALGTGLVLGFIVGLSRMALGAHFATDVLIAGAITLSSAVAFTSLFTRITRIKPLYIGLGVLTFALAVILGNRFTHQVLSLQIPGPIAAINLPCPVTSVPGDVTTPTLTVDLGGYGAPLSTLELKNENNTISLERRFGLYHHLSCTAQIAMPHQ